MNLTEQFKQNKYGVLEELAKQFGLEDSQVKKAIEWLTPALTRGLQRQAAEPSGLNDILKALKSGDHQKYVDDPSLLGNSATASVGNAILGHIFGSKEVSRDVAGRASQETGIGSSILQQMLPLVASAVMGALSKNVPTAAGVDQPDPEVQSTLMSWLDADKDGSVIDDILGHAFKQFVAQ